MAKKQTEETALATRSANTAMAVADQAVAGDTRGTENIEQSDIRLPFLSIAQKTSKAIDRTEGAYIPGLEFGQMYNSETREIYGEGPVEFIPVALRKRAHLLNENGTNGEQVAWDDPRVTWDGARAKHLEKPEGRQIYDWIVLLVPSLEMVVLSFYGKSFGTGKSLNGFVQIRKPSFAGKYALRTVIGKNDQGAYGQFKVAPAGKPTDDQYAYAEGAFTLVSQATIVTAADPVEPDDATNFNTSEM